jgi:mono/diheme cytochrome c family protein
VLPQETASIKNNGYLQSGTWTNAYVKENYPQAFLDGRIQVDKLLELSREDRAAVGRVIFQHHCNDCHATTEGYSAVSGLLRGRTREQVRAIVNHLDSVFFMPPWCGTPKEAELLTDYLMSIAPPRPDGMLVEVKNGEVN